ncbi:polysaccharide biosynthesis/export family protein [Crocosphaera sp. UHCC 0190]|uniref:polysaccharide biosynthesis/export family protein n=1 Tax=Crocosphaera sp. UHCC 0190 TaxID=3110246 RepID=UPI002B1F8B3F|nr:polysaccharide biosynthesis/export family protein [Crocosphaera sp. UHCC 0190]MEA5508460.1 polysaccharide biosynthesis/export family protein [Crocosphaera sp. UHCC 0190]
MRITEILYPPIKTALNPRLWASVVYGISNSLVFWSFAQGLFVPASLAQGSSKKSSEPFWVSQSPPPTFRNEDIPPENSGPPLFDVNTSEQFNLYRLAIGDVVNVSVREFPEFNFGGIIDPEGRIRVPFLGQISIVGLTLDEVETKVAYELGQRYLQEEPEVIAVLGQPRPVQLTILGEVTRPGYYFFGPGVTINNVITSVGGSTPKADLRSVIVRRSLVDGTLLEERVDLYTPLIQGKRLPEFRLQGGDTVIVSQLPVGQKDYDQTLIAKTNLAQPTIIVRVLIPTNPIGLAVRNLSLRNGSTFLDAVATLPPSIPLITQEEVTLLRFDPEQGKVVTQGLNPIGTVENLDVTQYVTLQNEDVIVVSRTLLGKVLGAFRVITQPIRDLLGFSNFIIGLPNTNFDGNNNNNNNNNFRF